MDTTAQPNTTTVNNVSANGGYRFALISLTTLFFMWGFITCLNDILIPYLKGALFIVVVLGCADMSTSNLYCYFFY